MNELLLDALIDSLKVFAFVALFTYVITAIEPLIANKVKLNGKSTMFICVGLSLLPQCGFSVVATDLYKRRHLTLGVLICVYLATCDEALPVFLSYPDMALHFLPVIGLKILIGLLIGFLIDIIFKTQRLDVYKHISSCKRDYKIGLTDETSKSLRLKDDLSCKTCDSDKLNTNHTEAETRNLSKDTVLKEENGEELKDCEEHIALFKKGILFNYNLINSKKSKTKKTVKTYVINLFLHSLEIFLYILIINIIFALLIYYIGEDKIISFLLMNKYLSPLFAVIIGAIPNCASSIILSKLYIAGGLGFGALLGGLCMNAGLGFVVLFKDIKHTKQNFLIFFLMFIISIIVSYLFSVIFNFSTLNI